MRVFNGWDTNGNPDRLRARSLIAGLPFNMNRVEAYRLLTEELNAFANVLARARQGSGETRREIAVLGSGGVRYQIELDVESLRDGRLAISGRIHDNNSQAFSLLEERLEFDPRRYEPT